MSAATAPTMAAGRALDCLLGERVYGYRKRITVYSWDDHEGKNPIDVFQVRGDDDAMPHYAGAFRHPEIGNVYGHFPPPISRCVKAAIDAMEYFVGAQFWELDNGWRDGTDGERIAGITCRLCTCGRDVAATAESVEMAIASALILATEPHAKVTEVSS